MAKDHLRYSGNVDVIQLLDDGRLGLFRFPSAEPCRMSRTGDILELARPEALRVVRAVWPPEIRSALAS